MRNLFLLAVAIIGVVYAFNANAALVFRGQFGGKSFDMDGYQNSTVAGVGLDMDRGERFLWGARLTKGSAEVTSNDVDQYWGQCQGWWCNNYNHVKEKFSVETVGLEVNAKHYFKRDKISYYALGFVGMNQLKLQSKLQTLKENYMSAGAGVGVDFEVGPQVALNLEGRYEAGLGASTDNNFGVHRVAKEVSKASSTSVMAGVVLSF